MLWCDRAWLGVGCRQRGSSIVGTDTAVGSELNEAVTVYICGCSALPHSGMTAVCPCIIEVIISQQSK